MNKAPEAAVRFQNAHTQPKSYVQRLGDGVSTRAGDILLLDKSERAAKIPNIWKHLKIRSKSVSDFTGDYFEYLMWKILGGALMGSHSTNPDLIVPDIETGECHYFQTKLTFSGNGATIKHNQLISHMDEEKYPNCWYAIGYHGCEKPEKAFHGLAHPSEFEKLAKPHAIYVFPAEAIFDWYFTTPLTEKVKKYGEWHKPLRENAARKVHQNCIVQWYSAKNYSIGGIRIHSIGYEISSHEEKREI